MASESALSPHHDAPRETSLCRHLTSAVKEAIRRMTDASARRDLWTAWQDWLASAPLIGAASAMPWDPAPGPEDPGATVSREHAQAAITAMLRELVASGYPAQDANALIPVIGNEMIRQEASGSPDLSGRPKCAHCGKPIPPERGPLARFCTNAHRVRAAERKRRERDGTGRRARTSVAGQHGDTAPAT